MIDKSVYEIEYIRELQKKYSSDPGLIERALYEKYVNARLEGEEYKKLAYIRKQSLDAYAYLVEATRNLE